MNSKRLQIFTWHIHGSYLYYLTQANCDFYIPVTNEPKVGYGGRAGSFPWGENVHEVPVEKVTELDLDCIVFQSKESYLTDQYEIFTPQQRELPRIYLEHDPPRESPTDTKHVVDDPSMLLVHVTHFNKLMWDNNRTPTTVIDHGVIVPPTVHYRGEIEKGIVVINNLQSRGRRLGQDIFAAVRKKIPLDIIGMGAKDIGGIGEVPHEKLPEFISQYRFFFNPIRYTSLGLSVCEAMMIGMPIVGLATTEMVTVFENGKTGFVHTNVVWLIEKMQELLENKSLAKSISNHAKEYAQKRFDIKRFTAEWEKTFQDYISAYRKS